MTLDECEAAQFPCKVRCFDSVGQPGDLTTGKIYEAHSWHINKGLKLVVTCNYGDAREYAASRFAHLWLSGEAMRDQAAAEARSKHYAHDELAGCF